MGRYDPLQGRRALYAQPRPSFEIALMAAGVPPEKIYPININDAFKALDELRPKINSAWKTSQCVLMQNVEVDLMGSSLSRTLDEKKRSGKVDFTFNQSIVEQDYWVIPKSASRRRQCAQLIAYALMAKRSARLCDEDAVQPGEYLDLLATSRPR